MKINMDKPYYNVQHNNNEYNNNKKSSQILMSMTIRSDEAFELT